ncbi:hypothetical protein [Streptomyces sp. NPDC053755]|uniref:hypothetical protein n=1 Tax=Streptomyces sp. NPDC053755 TaxID=3155815 RepID=UPI00342CA983
MRRMRPARVAGLVVGTAALSAPLPAIGSARAGGAGRPAASGAGVLAGSWSDAPSPAGAAGLAGGGQLAGFGVARLVRGRRRGTPHP